MLSMRRQLRANDFDFLGHLNQSIYHALLEDARLEFVWSRVTPDFKFVIVRSELDHHAEVPLENREVDLEVELERVGNSSFVLNQRIRRLDGVLAASGVATFACWDPEQRRSRPITDAEREALTKT